MEIQGESPDWSIGRLAELSGLAGKTIRFYSDAGLLPPRRTAAGHRRYAPADLPRLQLIRSLRALDVDLDTIADLLTDAAGLQETLLAHAKILEVRLHALQRQLAVTRAATEASAEQTLTRLHALTRIDAAEREQLLDRFWDAVLRDTPDRDAGWFRNAGRPQLPAQPTAAHLDAWLELAELAADPDFRRVTAAGAAWFAAHARPDFDPTAWQEDLDHALRLADDAEAAGIQPSDDRAAPAVDAYVTAHAHAFGREPSPGFRRWLAQQLTDLTDPRAERWWQLMSQLQPTPDPPRATRATRWLHQALADHASLSSKLPGRPGRRSWPTRTSP